jgi:hypothetical protein
MEGQGHRLGVPRVAGEAEKDEPIPSRSARRWNPHARKADPVGGGDLQPRCRWRQFRTAQLREPRGENEPGLATYMSATTG